MKAESWHVYLLLITGIFLFTGGCATLEKSLTAPPDFRQVWWGSTKASVLTKEQGKRIHANTGGSLVYKTRYGNVPILLIYCFRSHNGIYRLRAAGYLTATQRQWIIRIMYFVKSYLKPSVSPPKHLQIAVCFGMAMKP